MEESQPLIEAKDSKKAEIRFYDQEMDAAITEMDCLGIDFMTATAAKRHKAFVLEGKITDAANEDRREDFNRLLAKWRQCFN